VFVEEGRIVGVEDYGAPVPEGSTVHDHPGATLLPGLIDTHTHLVADASAGALESLPSRTDEDLEAVITTALRAHVLAGETTVRDLGDRRYLVVDCRDRAAPGAEPEVAKPRVLASGPPVTTVGGHCWFLGGEVAGPDGVVVGVRERLERRVDVVKVMASGGMLTVESDPLGVQFGIEDLRAAVEAAHAGGTPLTAHCHSLRAVENAVAAGVDGIEHCTCLGPNGLATTPELADRIAGAGIAVCPTVGVDHVLADSVPDPVPPPTIARLLEDMGGLTLRQLFDSRYPHVGMLASHGVNLLAGVDSGISPPKAHGFVHLAVEDLVVRCGMALADALAAATSRSADALGLGAVTGRLERGLAADLLVAGGDVRADLQALGRPERVVVQGHHAVSPRLDG
jgi:imidazolonepropionase-like amidohydrolase